MPVNYQIDPELALVFVRVTDMVSAAEMAAHHATLRADPSFSPDLDALVDFTGAEPFQGTGEEIRRLVADMPYNAGTRRAYVAAIDLHFGLSRMAQSYAEVKGIQVEVFRDRDSALRWLTDKA